MNESLSHRPVFEQNPKESASSRVGENKEHILRKSETYKDTSRSAQKPGSDRRNCLSKLPDIVNYLRHFYQDHDRIDHDDVVFAIENTRGIDGRTIRKYVRLLLRHDYLKPASKIKIFKQRVVSIQHKYSKTIRKYEVEEGFRYYVFGPRIPKAHQEKLVPLCTPPSRSFDEAECQNNMCASKSCGDSRDRASLEDMGEEKKEEEVVSHTHISITPLSKTEPTREELRILEASRRRDR